MRDIRFRHALLSILAVTAAWTVSSCATTGTPPPDDPNLSVDGPAPQKEAAAPEDGDVNLNGLGKAEEGGEETPKDNIADAEKEGGANTSGESSPLNNAAKGLGEAPANIVSNVPTNAPTNAVQDPLPDNTGLGGGENFDPTAKPTNGELPANGLAMNNLSSEPQNSTVPANGSSPAPNNLPTPNASGIQAVSSPSQTVTPVGANTVVPANTAVPANTFVPPPSNALLPSNTTVASNAAVPAPAAPVVNIAPMASLPSNVAVPTNQVVAQEEPEQPSYRGAAPLSGEELDRWRSVAGKLRSLAPGEGPGEYIVQPGDTLWDISDQLLDDSSWWPQLWVLNPKVEDPNLIYPGMKLVFYPSDAANSPQLAAHDLGEAYPIAADAQSITRFPSAAGHPWEGKEGLLLDPRELGGDPNFDYGGGQVVPGSYMIQVPGFLSSSSPAAVGVVTGDGERMLFAMKGGVAYAKFSGEAPRPGEKFLVVRQADRGPDPTGEIKSGPDFYLYSGIVGILKTHASGKVSLLVEDTRQGVREGDLLIPFRNINQQFDPHAGGRASGIKAEVLAIAGQGLGLAVAGQFVFLSRGEGAVAGGDDIDLFMPPGNIINFKEDELDSMLVAKAKVVDVGEEGIVALIVSSTREVSIGAKTWSGF